ncbi:MAG: thioredoxin fold domain-containing protein, partial [Proteobacteria bacterium]|nr:thioredoxin fold domain-containing protein [Pseudomonadota bacterium]
SLPAWERAFYAFLAEKERRSGSKRTVDAYSRTLQRFFGTLGKPPDQVTSQNVFAFAHGRGPSGREPALVTIGARLACVSSFYRFLIRMKILDSNPCDMVERPRVSPSPPRGLTPEDIRHSVTVFTDVDCTYCRRLHSQIDAYLAHGIEVRYMLYPRNGPASRSWGISEDIYCSSDRNKALTAAKLDRSFQTVACDTSVIQDTYALGQEIGFSGTPAIILEDGTLIGGYLPPDALNQRLNN